MSNVGKSCLIGCFCLVAAASAISVTNAASLDASETDAAATQTPQPPPVQEHSIAQAEPATRGNPLWGIPLKQLSVTRDRPIFSPSRRPPPSVDAPVAAVIAPPVQAPKPPEHPQLSLLGTITHGDDGIAIFVDQTTNAPLRIRMGADYQGWMLSRVEARSVTLQKGEDVAVLSFPKPANNQGVPTGAGLIATAPAPAVPAPPQAAMAQMAPHYLSPESNALPPRPRRMFAGRH